MKLNYKRTILVGFAFFLISAFWQAYDATIPVILTNKFGMSQTWSGVIMALDNVLAVFMLPMFGALSDKCNTKHGKRTPFITIGTTIAAVALVCLSFVDSAQLNNISAVIGTRTLYTTLITVAIAAVAMLIYVAFRFQFASGVASVLCLLHDLFVMLVVYSLFQIPLSTSVIAAFLTILGYSINATIVVFDRIRENRRKDDQSSFGDVVNTSIHETMGRSVNTTITTLLTIGAVFVACAVAVIIFPTSNLDTLRDFAGTLIVGILSGLFSSVFLSGMIWNALSGIKLGKKAK
jgi:preprotein translocase SecF subunit